MLHKKCFNLISICAKLKNLKAQSKTSKSKKRTRQGDTGYQGSASSKTKRSRVSPDQGHKSDNENFEVEEEILVDIDNNRPKWKETRTPTSTKFGN